MSATSAAVKKEKVVRLIDRISQELPAADVRASRSKAKQTAHIAPKTQRVNARQSRTAVDTFIKDQEKKIRLALVTFSKDRDIQDTPAINTFCDFFHSLHYEEIKNIIEEITAAHYQEIFANEDASGVINILNNIEKRLRTLLDTPENRDIILLELEKQHPDSSKELIKNSISDSALNKILENIINKLIYDDLKPLMLETLKYSFREKLSTETNASGYTALHLACQANNVPLAKTLIQSGWQNVATDNAPVPTFLADPKVSAELLAYINKSGKALSIPKGGEGLIAFRGHLEPMPIKVGIRVNGKDYPAESFSKKIKLILRTPTVPVPREPTAVTTPKKTKLIRSSIITFNKDNPSEFRNIELMLEADLADKKIAVLSHAKKIVPASLKTNTKLMDSGSGKTPKTFITTITPEILATWARIGEDKSRNQGQVMGNISAGVAADAAGYLDNDANKWEWCHLIAHSMGGEGGQVPKIPSDSSRMGPQRETNLVVGTAEANSQMIVIESVVKDLINYHNIPSLCLKVKPTFVKGLEAYHIAEKLEYTIQDHPDNPTHQVTVEFDMLSRQKVFPGQLEITSTLLVQDFLDSNKLKAAKGKSSDKSAIGSPSPTTAVPAPAIAITGSKVAPGPAASILAASPHSSAITAAASFAKPKFVKPKKYQPKAEKDEQLGWNCFDIAAGIDRDDLVRYAIANKDANGGELKNLLAPEIKNALTLTLIFLNYRQALENANEEEAVKNANNIQKILHNIDSLKDADAKAKLEIKLHQLLAKSDQITPSTSKDKVSKAPVSKPATIALSSATATVTAATTATAKASDGSKDKATKKPIEYTGFLAELRPYILPEAMHDNPIIKTLLDHLANYQDGHERMPAVIRTLFDRNPLAAGAIRARYAIPANRMPTIEQIDEFVNRNADVRYRDPRYDNFCSAYRKERYDLIGQHEAALNNGCISDPVYTTYVNEYYGNHEWVAFQRNLAGEQSTSIVDIVAKKENAKIIIVDANENEIYNTRRTVPLAPREIVIQYNGHNHFIGIERIDQQLHQSPMRARAIASHASPVKPKLINSGPPQTLAPPIMVPAPAPPPMAPAPPPSSADKTKFPNIAPKTPATKAPSAISAISALSAATDTPSPSTAVTVDPAKITLPPTPGRFKAAKQTSIFGPGADSNSSDQHIQNEIEKLQIHKVNLVTSIDKLKEKELSSAYTSPSKRTQLSDFITKLENVEGKIQTLQKKLSTYVAPVLLRPDSTLVAQLAHKPLNLDPVPATVSATAQQPSPPKPSALKPKTLTPLSPLHTGPSASAAIPHTPTPVRTDSAATPAQDSGTLTAFKAHQSRAASIPGPARQNAPQPVQTSPSQRLK